MRKILGNGPTLNKFLERWFDSDDEAIDKIHIPVQIDNLKFQK